jgi:hypothetical protein
MSKLSRDKGTRIEREIVAAHEALGIKAERVPLSGASRYQGNGSDVDVYAFGPDGAPLVCEVKARASGEGFATLERWLGRQLPPHSAPAPDLLDSPPEYSRSGSFGASIHHDPHPTRSIIFVTEQEGAFCDGISQDVRQMAVRLVSDVAGKAVFGRKWDQN